MKGPRVFVSPLRLFSWQQRLDPHPQIVRIKQAIAHER